MAPQKMLRKLSYEAHNVLNAISREDIRLVYTFTRRLNSGSFGTVRIAYKTAIGEEAKFAVKSIKRSLIMEK